MNVRRRGAENNGTQVRHELATSGTRVKFA